MKRIPVLSLFAVAVGSLVALSASSSDRVIQVQQTVPPLTPQEPQQPQQVVVTLINSGGRQPKVGLPDFLVPAGDAELQNVARTLVDVLWNDLDFEKEYYLIPRDSSASIPPAPADALPHERWQELGADLVIVASLQRNGPQVNVELRLVSVRKESAGKQAYGSQYGGCTMANPRACAHYISDDIHKKTRDLNGVARTRLAFTSDRDASAMTNRPTTDPGRGKEIYIADYDGANQARATANRSLNIAPAWAPDGRALAFTSWALGFVDIYVMTFDAKAPQRPAKGMDGFMNSLPAWSPDGSRMAFVSTRGGNSDIYVMDRNGNDLRNLTNNEAIDNAPTWSPTGAQIAFTSRRTGTNQLWVMTADGGAVSVLTSGSDIDRPTWSPVGSLIAYTCGSAPGHDICTIDIATRTITVLTDSKGDNQSPSFAPNGRHLAYKTTRWGLEQIAIIDINGKNVRKITSSGNNTYPSWSRSPGGQ